MAPTKITIKNYIKLINSFKNLSLLMSKLGINAFGVPTSFLGEWSFKYVTTYGLNHKQCRVFVEEYCQRNNILIESLE